MHVSKNYLKLVPALVHLLQPKACKTFDDYATVVFMPYINSNLQNVNRADLVWDTYLPDSLKNFTHLQRRKGK